MKKKEKLPKTNVQSTMSYVLVALAGLGGVYISTKKKK
ncbi:LPXTG cell wall anchor domain-containing protein [Parvimonas sp.]